MDGRFFRSPPVQKLLRGVALLAVGWLLAGAAGCALMEKCGCIAPAESTQAPIGHVETFWHSDLRFADDSQTGKPVPGVIGRVWVYADGAKFPIAAKGRIEACMYDMTPTASGGQPVQLAYWRFQADDLKKLKQEDKVGMGYTVFLPLETYRPDVKQVQLRLGFVDEKGVQTVAEPTTMMLRSGQEAARVRVESRQVVPTAAK